MKAYLLATILLLLIPVAAPRAETIKPPTVGRDEARATASWAANSIVKVYFVRDVFTSAQRQMVWEAIETWARSGKRSGATFTFVYAGETGGLIDCVGCLTVTRQEIHTNDSRRRVSVNSLRHDTKGQLISAWIGLDSGVTKSQRLRALMLQALEQVFEIWR